MIRLNVVFKLTSEGLLQMKSLLRTRTTVVIKAKLAIQVVIEIRKTYLKWVPLRALDRQTLDITNAS